MPMRAPKPCGRSGCPTLIQAGQRYCERHLQETRQVTDAMRGTTAERGYDAAWQKLRLSWLRAHPLCQCEDCQEGVLQLRVATVVDHRQPIAERPDLRLDPTNLRSMSKPCHDRHTARTRGWGRVGRYPDGGVKSSRVEPA
jgi:5-methylcytosine-specific restriction protein A